MNARLTVCLALFCLAPSALRAASTVASVIGELHNLSIDPAQTYRVRELQIARGDIKIYLTEGILSFAKPVDGKIVAAVFSTAETEAGDGEVIVLPPTRSERASLASFSKTPNIDEHISSALFFFSDETAQELRAQMAERPMQPAADEGKELAASASDVLRAGCAQIDVKLALALLDKHSPERGVFYGIVGGRELGVFDVAYEPERSEPVVVGKIVMDEGGGQFFQIWSSFRPRRKGPAPETRRGISDYRVETFIQADLSMKSQAKFQYRAVASDGRTIGLELSSRLRVTAARIDGQPAEFYRHDTSGQIRFHGPEPLLLLAAETLAPEAPHEVEVSYEGSVVRRTALGNYFVDDRNTWYPFLSPMLTTFDLTFHCPAALRVVSTGELIADEVAGGLRTVHRKTQVPEPLAGFNLGNYEVSTSEHGPYRIELFADNLEKSASLPAQAANILDYYTARWQPLSIHSIAISPVEGYFGQGFPGLIYLSSVSYMREEDRPAALRNPQLDSFFSQVLLPHEIAHQWWGNAVSQADYRAAWLFEAMSNYSALQYLEHNKGRAALDAVMEQYRQDLLAVDKGKSMESSGPVDFGERLLDSRGMRAWHVIVYEKGAWILHMLRLRLGDDAFHTLQTRLLADFKGKLISNDDFRKLAASLLPANQADRSLNLFFENWVYATGVPRLNLRGSAKSLSLKVSGLEESFDFDLPLRCQGAAGSEKVEWVRAVAGDNSYDMPEGSRACQLPRQTDYLYQPEN